MYIRTSQYEYFNVAHNETMPILVMHLLVDIYLTKKKKKKKKKKLDGFYFSVISWFLRNPTYRRSIFSARVYVHHTHLFSTRLIFQITLNAKQTCFGIFCTCTVTHW